MSGTYNRSFRVTVCYWEKYSSKVIEVQAQINVQVGEFLKINKSAVQNKRACEFWIIQQINVFFLPDADDFEPVVKPAGPPAAFKDKWEGEDEDDDVKVSVFLEGHFRNFKLTQNIGHFLGKVPNFQIQDLPLSL